jgi:Tfp pilus assembly protein PilX
MRCAVQRATQGERGATLVTALFLMLAVLIVGVSAARAALGAEKSARFERDRHIAFAAAEAALLDAERDIEGGPGAEPARSALFAAGAAGFADGCGRDGDNLGLCRAAAASAAPVWQVLDLAGNLDATTAYGGFTGARMATGSGILPARLPRYIIEFVEQQGAAAQAGALYRITAIGFGGREATRVVLQSFYRKPPTPGQGSGQTSPAAPPAGALPAGRSSWREVASWPELHAAAIQ